MDDDALNRNQIQVFARMYHGHAGHVTGLVRNLIVDMAHTAAGLGIIQLNGAAFAKTFFRNGEDFGRFTGYRIHSHYQVAGSQLNTLDTVGLSAHTPHIFFLKEDGDTFTGSHEDMRLTVGETHAD